MSLFPQSFMAFRYLTLTQNKPSEFFECCLLFDHYCLTMIHELYVYMYICPVFLCKLNSIKAHWGTGSWSFSFERLATFPPQADHGRLILIHCGWGALQAKLLHTYTSNSLTLSPTYLTFSFPNLCYLCNSYILRHIMFLSVPSPSSRVCFSHRSIVKCSHCYWCFALVSVVISQLTLFWK